MCSVTFCGDAQELAKGIVKQVINGVREKHMTPNSMNYPTGHPVIWDSTWTYHSGNALHRATTANTHTIITGTIDRERQTSRRGSVSEFSQCMGHMIKGALFTEPMLQYAAEKAKEYSVGNESFSLRWVKFLCVYS